MSGPQLTTETEPSQPSGPATALAGDPGLPEPHVHGLDRLHVLYKYRKVVIFVALLGLAAGVVQTSTTPTAYMGAAVVRAEPDAAPASATAAQGLAGDDFMRSELSMIQSRDLKRRVVRRLRLDRNPQFEASPDPQGLDGAFAALRGRIAKPLQAMLSSTRSAASGPAVPAGAPVTAPLTPEQVETPAETRAIETIAANLQIQPQPQSHLFTISFSSGSPTLSADLANAVATEYASDSPERRLEQRQNQLKSARDKVLELSAQIEAGEQTLRSATSDAAVIDHDVITRNVASAQTVWTSKRSARLAAETKSGEMEALDPETHLDSAQTYPDVLSATALSRQQIATLILDRRTVIKQGAAADSILVKAIDLQIARLQQDVKTEIRQRIEAARQDYAARLSDERAADLVLKAQQDLQARNNRAVVSYGALKQEVGSDIRLRDDLVTQQQALEAGVKTTANNVTVVEYARPPLKPYKPDALRNILISLAASLVLGLMIAFGLDYLDDTIKTPEDITRRLHIPFLGLVPAVRGDRPPVVSGPVPHDFGEAYRALRTSLVFTSGAETTRIVTVTSAQPLEGKTTTACNLALVLAFGGSRVLLIDADMRRPGVHKALKMGNSIGLSHLLVGQARVREAIQRTSDPNLCVMTAGRTPPNPSELLASERLKQLVANLKQGPFDWVVIDTPPVLAVTDAVVLTPFVDGVTLVIGAEMTRRGLAERAVQMLMTGRPKVIGAVLNRVNFDSNKYYYSRYFGYQYKRYYGTEPTKTTAATA